MRQKGQVKKKKKKAASGVDVLFFRGKAELRALEKSHNYRARKECQLAARQVGSLSGPGRVDAYRKAL